MAAGISAAYGTENVLQNQVRRAKIGKPRTFHFFCFPPSCYKRFLYCVFKEQNTQRFGVFPYSRFNRRKKLFKGASGAFPLIDMFPINRQY